MNHKEREAIIEAYVHVKSALNSIRHFKAIQETEHISVDTVEKRLEYLFERLRHRVFDEMELQINDFGNLRAQLNNLIINDDADAAFDLLREETLLNPHGCQIWVDWMASDLEKQNDK